MTSCPSSAPAPFTCPDLVQSIQATAALLPRGAAWPANDGGGTVERFLAWLAGLGTPPAAPASWPAGYVQAGFIAALGSVRNWIEGRFCALKAEFFCATASETLDLWNLEYGLPDACDPFPNLCAKVATIGGAPTCAFWTEAAAALGWAVECDAGGSQLDAALAGNALAGVALCGRGIQATVVEFVVLLASSAAYNAAINTPPLAGHMLAGRQIACLPDITSLTCMFDRILPAHLTVGYVID